MIVKCFESHQDGGKAHGRHFENMRTLDDRCEGFIKTVWEEPVEGNVTVRCLKNLDRCRGELE